MTDLERKLYRIIYNMSRFRKNPSIDDLKRKTGKDELAIRKAVKNLVSRKELTWDKEKMEWRFNKKDLHRIVARRLY
ncbi:hypothetical protein [Bacillus pumilus]|uniref:hypothetical protein n=1 Tax=Bacillus pumilus TaxID=1408 RepID=UPI0007EE99AC|nr:hypothetical protein [Bacillus pumilus]MBU8573822.1 hypothetical protein [Bacillus pumilus]OBS85360.1 hypothetical protein BAY68_06495 [Bacillus pumilus]